MIVSVRSKSGKSGLFHKFLDLSVSTRRPTMSKRKQTHAPITYKEKPPLWMQMPLKSKEKKEEKPAEDVDPLEYDEIIIVEAEAAENNYHLEEDQQHEEETTEVVVDKDKTREFVRKSMEKLMATLDDLIEIDDHAYVVNFVLEMSGQAKKKYWEMQGLSYK